MCKSALIEIATAKGATSRGPEGARATSAAGLWRNGPMRCLVVVMFALAAPHALGQSRDGGARPVASAAIDFRIVIPETLHLGSQPERRRKSVAFVSRTTQSVNGRTVVTVARP